MLTQTMDLLVGALENQTYGVNMMLQSASLPQVDGIYSELDDYWVCVGGAPERFPVLIVTLAEDIDVTTPEIRTSIREENITLAVSYWGNIEDTPVGSRAAYNTLNCVLKTFRQWADNSNAADRISGNIQIVSIDSIRQTPRAVSQNQDSNILASLVVTFRVRDVTP